MIVTSKFKLLNFILNKICVICPAILNNFNKVNETSRYEPVCLNDLIVVTFRAICRGKYGFPVRYNNSMQHHQSSTRISLIKSPRARDRVLTPTKITLLLFPFFLLLFLLSLLLLLSSIQQILFSFCHC